MLNRTIRSQKGITLIEILVAIVILGMIAMSFIPLFIQSARTNSHSEKMIDATYVAQSFLEEIYFLSENPDINIKNELLNMGYEKELSNCHSDLCYSQENNGYYIWTELTNINSNNSLPHAIVRIYEDHSKQKLEAQMETILP